MADERTQAHSLLDRVAQLGSQTGVVVGQGLNVRGSRVFCSFCFLVSEMPYNTWSLEGGGGVGWGWGGELGFWAEGIDQIRIP